MTSTENQQACARLSSTSRADIALAARRFLGCLPRNTKRLIMMLSDIAMLGVALIIAFNLRADALSQSDADPLYFLLATALLVSIPTFIIVGLYRPVIRYLEARIAQTVLVSVTAAVIATQVSLYFLGLHILRPATLLLYWLLALLAVGGSRVVAYHYFRRPTLRSEPRNPVIIYGAGEAGVQLAISLKNSSLVPVAFVDDNPDLVHSSLYGLKVYPAQHIGELIDQHQARQVLLAMPSASKAHRRAIFDRIQHLPVRVRTIPSLANLLEGRSRISDIEDLGLEDLVGRDPAPAIPALLAMSTQDKVVLVTGAGGSIGSQLCRQILSLRPRKLILFDISEFALYSVNEELLAAKDKHGYSTQIVTILGSVAPAGLLTSVMAAHAVEVVYHAAAYKHVPLVETNAIEGIRNNVIGTLRAAEAAIANKVALFVLISTDKAVRPTNIMGASKRMAELIMQALGSQGTTRFCMVRFGNVLDSSGSVVPLFRKQVRAGGPVCVTHPEITRYFMTIPEAAQLVLQAGAMARGGDVFVLDMGSPVKIVDLARRIIQLSGLRVRDDANPQGDIEIRFTGLRPGEKLYEELIIGEDVSGTEHPLIMRAVEDCLAWSNLKPLLSSLDEACRNFDERKAVAILSTAVPLFTQTATGLQVADSKMRHRSVSLRLVALKEETSAAL